MTPIIGMTYLVTTSDWFFAPDGNSYKAVFGRVNAILNDEQTLGIKTNRGSANWYLSIGRMHVAGCQIHYVIQCDGVSDCPPTLEDEAGRPIRATLSRIYRA